MGLFSSIAGIFGAAKTRKAIDRASSVLQDGAQRGIDTIGAQTAAGQTALTGQATQNDSAIQSVLATLAPFIQGGQQAFGAQGDLLGLGGNDKQAAAIASLKDSPLFRSLYTTGADTVLQNGSATGGLRGGNIQSSLATFGSDTLAKVIQQQLTNLGGLSGQGLNAAGTGAQTTLGGVSANTGISQSIAGLLGNSGVNIANLFGAQAGAQAGGILGKASASNDMLTNSMKAIQDGLAAIAGMPGGGSMSQLAASAGKLF